jgi:hypothetical protein
MAYQPQRKMVSSSYGPSGKAMITIHPDGKRVRVQLKSDDGNVTEYAIKRDQCPEALMNGVFFVQLSEQKNKIMGVRPWDGVFAVHTDKFAAKEGQPPIPKHNEKFNYYYFTVMLEITDGAEKGMQIPLTLRYWFDGADEMINGSMKKALCLEFHPKSKYMPHLVDYLDVAGVWESGPMPYKDNVLPMLEKRALAAGKHFNVVMKAGYVQSILGTNKSNTEFSSNQENDWNGDDAPLPSSFAPDVEE